MIFHLTNVSRRSYDSGPFLMNADVRSTSAELVCQEAVSLSMQKATPSAPANSFDVCTQVQTDAASLAHINPVPLLTIALLTYG